MSGRVFPILKDYQKFTSSKDGGFVTVDVTEFSGFTEKEKVRINVPGISSLTIVPEGQYITHRDELKKKYNKTEPIIFSDIAYKSGTNIIEESQKLKLALKFAEIGYQVIIKDTVEIISQVKELYGRNFNYQKK